MADQTVTAAEVLPLSDTQSIDGTFGATITAGQVVYKNSSDGEWYLADTDASVTAAAAVGIALCGGGNGQPGKIAIGGTIDPGFTVTVGQIYVLSGTAGAIQLDSDLAQNDWVTLIGVGLTASTLKLNIYASGVQVP